MTTKNIMKLRGVPWGLAVLVTGLAAASLQAQQVSTIISNGLYYPSYITTDPSNFVYFTDSGHNRIMKFDTAETNLTALAGTSNYFGFKNGTGGGAWFYDPEGIVYDAFRGGLVVSDTDNQIIRFVTGGGVVTTLAGIPATKNSPYGGTNDGGPGVGQLSYPAGIATDNAGNIYIADSGNSLLRILNSANVLSTIVITNVVQNGAPLPGYVLQQPAAVAFDTATKNLWVADTGHETICLITNLSSLNNTLFVVAGTPGEYGFSDSVAGVSSALFYLPNGLLWTTNGNGLLIGDTGNDTIRQLTGSLSAGFSVQTIAGNPGVSSNFDGPPLSAYFNHPVGLAFDTKDGGYYIVDQNNNSVRSLVLTAPVIPPTNTVPPESQTVNPPSFTPNTGYYTNCVTIIVNSEVPDVYYSVNGQPPASGPFPNGNATLVSLTNNPAGGFEGSFQFCNPEENLSSIEMVAINGTNFSTTVSGPTPVTNSIGVPYSQLVGAGSTAVIPVVASLEASTVLQSYQFRFEISTNGNAPNILPVGTNAGAVTVLDINSTDFVSVIGPVPGNTPFEYILDTSWYPFANGTQGAIISTANITNGYSSNFFSVTSNAVLALLKVTIPTNAVQGQSYTLNVIAPSGTSDGKEAGVPLYPMPSQTLTVSNLQYFAGDTAPSGGYSAGEFGNGLLDNSDVNLAIFASFGYQFPDSATDAYNAMSVVGEAPAFEPESANFIPGYPTPKTRITMEDWETILARSVGLETNTWIRYWTNSAAGAILTHTKVGWTNGIATPIGVPNIAPVDATPPGLVWAPNATIRAGSASGVSAGQSVTIPVSVAVQPGCTLGGMQFRAILSANNGAPAAGSIQFNAASGITSPAQLNGQSPADIACYWEVPLGPKPSSGTISLQGSNLIGSISFTVPAGAAPGQSYSLRFLYVDGMKSLGTGYQLESIPGTILVGVGAVTPQITSDEWRTAFFGSLTSPEAQDNADPDGDGIPNWQEYLAGTNPTNALSCLKLAATGGASQSVNLGWLTAPGKTYLLESSPTLGATGWTGVSSFAGDGNPFLHSVTNHSPGAVFYRIRLQQ